jgi:isoleucyl-tRNA synthetase
MEEKWGKLFKLREKSNLVLETSRKAGDIGSALEAALVISGGTEEEKALLRSVEKILPAVFIVSKVSIQDGNSELEMRVQKAAGQKCARCWRYQEDVHPEGHSHAGLCARCASNL